MTIIYNDVNATSLAISTGLCLYVTVAAPSKSSESSHSQFFPTLNGDGVFPTASIACRNQAQHLQPALSIQNTDIRSRTPQPMRQWTALVAQFRRQFTERMADLHAQDQKPADLDPKHYGSVGRFR